jgi:hypothetical protein
MPTELRTCPSCGEERLFEAPPCPDGHGADCPELACIVCGTALLVGTLVSVQWSHPPAHASSGSVMARHAA